jgi:hypothetical protein
MPTVEELIAQLQKNSLHPNMHAVLEQVDADIAASRQAEGQGFLGQIEAGLQTIGGPIVAPLYQAIDPSWEPRHPTPYKTAQTGLEKTGRFIGEVLPEIGIEAGILGATGGASLPWQIAASGLAGTAAGAAGGGLPGAALGAATGVTMPWLFGRFGRKTTEELLNLSEDELKLVLEDSLSRTMSSQGVLKLDDAILEGLNRAKRQKATILGRPWEKPGEIDMLGEPLKNPELSQILNIMEGKQPGKLPPLSMLTLYDAAASGDTRAFKGIMAKLGKGKEEIDATVKQVTAPMRDTGGRFTHNVGSKERGRRFKALSDEAMGGRPAGDIPNTDVVEVAMRRARETLPVEEVDNLAKQAEAEDAILKSTPTEEIPRITQQIEEWKAAGADLTKMLGRFAKKQPFLKPAGVGARKHLATLINETDTALTADMRASGVPKKYIQQLMGLKPPDEGITPLTVLERAGLGKKVEYDKQTFVKKWHDILKGVGAEPKKQGLKSEKGGLYIGADEIRTDFSPLTGESGVLMLGRLMDGMPREQIEKLIQYLPKEMSKYSKHAKKDNLLTLWYNALLLNPATIIRNLVGNTVEFGMEGLVRQTKKTLSGQTFKALSNGDVNQALNPWAGFGQGWTNAWTSFGEAWRTGMIKAIREGSEDFIDAPITTAAAKGPASKILSAMDDWYTTMAYHIDAQDRVYRKAINSGKRGGALQDEIVRMNANLPDDIDKAAMSSARRTVYRDLAENQFEETSLEAIRKIQSIPLMGRLMLPFGPTLLRLGKRTTEYTPMGFVNALSAQFFKKDEQLAKAGIDRLELVADRLFRAMYGTTAISSLVYLGYQDRLTGSMEHLTDSQRDAVRAGGAQPYSVRIGDNWFSYRNLGPPTGVLQVAANLAEGFKHGGIPIEGDLFEDFFNTTLQGTGMTLEAAATQTFLPGLVDIAQAIVDPDRMGKKGIQSLLRYSQPSTGVAALARAIDPTIREHDLEDPETLFFKRVPGLTGKLPAKLGLFGEELKRTATQDPTTLQQIETFLSPVQRKRISQDPVVQEVARLQAPLGAPSMDLDIETLTKDDKWVSSKAMGILQKKFVSNVINSPFYQGLPDERKVALLKRAHQKGRNIVNKRVKAFSRQGKSITYRALLKGLVAE